MRALFNMGSHHSFVTSKTAGLANPKDLRREFLGINTFGQKCANTKQREVVELKLELVTGNKVVCMEALIVPEIYSIQNGHVELVQTITTFERYMVFRCFKVSK